MCEQALIDYAGQYGIKMTREQSQLLLKNMSLILAYNQAINLTAIRDEALFIDKHLIDSLLCPLKPEKSPLQILDVGTGGGFPGVPMAILYPMHHFTLLDSTGKKLRIVEKISGELGLRNTSFLEGRAEVLAHTVSCREKYDVVVSRGVASYSILSELCTPFLKIGGTFLAWKGPGYQDELTAAKSSFGILNMKINEIKKENLLKTDGFRVIIDSEKIDHTPARYPRNFGTMKKKPL